MSEAYPSRREHARLPITLEVNYRTEMEFLNASTKDISSGGMFIHTMYPLPEGTELNVQFSIPEVPMNFSVMGKIVWAATIEETENAVESGMGIEFLNLDPKKSKMLEDYIKEKASKK